MSPRPWPGWLMPLVVVVLASAVSLAAIATSHRPASAPAAPVPCAWAADRPVLHQSCLDALARRSHAQPPTPTPEPTPAPLPPDPEPDEWYPPAPAAPGPSWSPPSISIPDFHYRQPPHLGGGLSQPRTIPGPYPAMPNDPNDRDHDGWSCDRGCIN